MSSFHGLCSFPHGTQNSVFLWASIACATICTCYSIASCRLFMLQFHSDLGNFEDHFTMTDATSITPLPYEVGVGLFTWLRPSFYVDGDDDTVTRAQVGNWREGSCVGYNTLQLERILDDWWEATRILGVFSVLISWSIFLFSLMMSCLSIANWQRYLMAMSCVAAALINGMVLLMNQSKLCQAVGSEGFRTTCEWDQGALVAIAGVILWVCSALLSFCFIEPFRPPGYEAEKRKQLAAKKKAQRMKQKEKEFKKQQQKEAKKKKEKTVHASFSVPKSSKSAKNTVEEDVESARAVKEDKKSSKRQSSKRQSSKKAAAMAAAVASTPTLHEDDDEEAQISRQSRKSSFQRGFEKRSSRRESKKDTMVPPDVEEDYDCIPLHSSESNGKRNSSSGSNPIRDYVIQARENSRDAEQHEKDVIQAREDSREEEQREKDLRASLSSNKQGSTAGEILIDLKSADSAIIPRQSQSSRSGSIRGSIKQRSGSIKSIQRNGSIKSKQEPVKEQPRASSTQRSSSMFEDMGRMLFFTDVPDPCGGAREACHSAPPKEYIEVEADDNIAKAMADDISLLTSSTTQQQKQQFRRSQVQQAIEQDLALQKSKDPFACDPGCFP